MKGSSSEGTTELPQPSDDPGLLRTFDGYKRALAGMTVAQLMEHSASLSAKLQEQQAGQLQSLISQPLQDSISSLDRLQVRSTPAGTQSASPRDRGAAASQPSRAPTQPGALDRLASSKRLAPRIAAKLVLHDARRQARRSE